MKTLSLDAPAPGIRFQSLFLFNKTHRRHQIQSIGNAEQNPCCYQQHVIEANMKSSSPSTEAEQVGCCTPAWQRDCFVLCLCLMKLHHQHVVTNTYRVTAATHADRLLTSVHTSSIWSHITVERKSCRCICEGKKDLIYLSCEQTLRCLPHCLTHLRVTDSMLNCCGSHACAGPHGFTAKAWSAQCFGSKLENTALDLMFCFNYYHYNRHYFPSVVSRVSFSNVQSLWACDVFRHVIRAEAEWKVSVMQCFWQYDHQ